GQAALISSLRNAIQEAGIKAQLSSVDCTEYPCIAFFDRLEQSDVDALKRSPAYQPYAKDHFFLLGRSGPDGPFDAISVLPADDAHPRNDVRERLRFRLGQMLP